MGGWRFTRGQCTGDTGLVHDLQVVGGPRLERGLPPLTQHCVVYPNPLTEQGGDGGHPPRFSLHHVEPSSTSGRTSGASSISGRGIQSSSPSSSSAACSGVTSVASEHGREPVERGQRVRPGRREHHGVGAGGVDRSRGNEPWTHLRELAARGDRPIEPPSLRARTLMPVTAGDLQHFVVRSGGQIKIVRPHVPTRGQQFSVD